MSVPVDDRVIQAIGSAYYARAATAADLARTRAQNAFAVTSFLACGFVGVSLFGGLAARPLVVQLVGACALLAWVATAALYSRAVAEPVPLETRAQPTPAEFVQKVLDNAAEERDAIDTRRATAQKASFVAAALTALTALGGIVLAPGHDTRSATLFLSAPGVAAHSALCGTESNPIHGKVDMESLEHEFVRVEASPDCNGREIMVYRNNVFEMIVGN